ncbi:unnamed protein product [Heligmosomoides polygyrus]|uniref:Transthyretin-like family protein n=1 Tax=Heligmosomoides polygyrus TaxID=6339 RepID=A0A183FDH4_HELPZ|nr:unnamed protein product [Heligmosomoides polygyrus]
MRCLVLLVILGASAAMRQQAVGVRGRLMCGDVPAVGVKVKLWDEDDGPDPDDQLDEGYTDNNGNFRLQGTTRELTNIDPVFKVYHDCDDGFKNFVLDSHHRVLGQRKLKFRIPDKYITSGGVPRRYFNIGELNLETIFKCEERDLL